jgi:Tfp pilus assembly protein PilN
VSQVNLLPPELRQRQATRRLTSIIVAAGLGVLAIIGVFYFMQTQKLSDVQSELEAQQASNAELSAEIESLSQYAALQDELAAKEVLVASLYVNEVSWSVALLDISRVIPDASYLTNLTGQITATTSTVPGEVPTAPTGGTPETTLIGNMTFAGVADQIETIASWLTRLEQVQGWVNAWANSAQENAAFSRIYTFSNGIDLTQEAATERGQAAEVTP